MQPLCLFVSNLGSAFFIHCVLFAPFFAVRPVQFLAISASKFIHRAEQSLHTTVLRGASLWFDKGIRPAFMLFLEIE